MSTFPKPDSFEEAVVVYETPWCGFCRLAKELLIRRKIIFAIVDVNDDRPARAWLAAMPVT